MPRPTVEKLEKQLKDLVRNWDSFGRNLPGITESDLDVMKYNKRDDVESQKTALYRKWLKAHPDASWDDVTGALHEIGENTIAKHVEKWLSSVEKEMSLSPKPQLQNETTDSNTLCGPSSQAVYNVPENVVDKLKELHKTFVPLASQTKNEIETRVNEGEVKVKSLVNYVEEERAFPIESSVAPVTDTDGFFQSIKPHYNFLSPYLLIALAIHFLTGNIVQELKNYNDRITTFNKTTHVRSLVKTLQRYHDHLRPTTDNIIVKVTVKRGFDHRLTIWVVQMLIQTLFPVMHHSELPWYEVGVGSLVPSFIATNNMMLPLIVSCARKMEFMSILGIVSVSIGNVLIRVNKDEQAVQHEKFSYEYSLIEAITSENIEAVEFLLKYTQVNVNSVYNNTNQLIALIHKFDRCPNQEIMPESEILENLTNNVHCLKAIIRHYIMGTCPDDPPHMSKFLNEIEYCILNTEFVEKKIYQLPKQIKEKLVHYSRLFKEIKLEVKIRHLKQFLQSTPTLNYTTRVTITFNKVWSDYCVDRIEKNIYFLFPNTSLEKFHWFRVKLTKKTLKVTLLTMKPPQFNHPHSANALGVIKVRINNVIIFKNRENIDSYTIKKGIHHAAPISQKLAQYLTNVSLVPLGKQNQKEMNNNNIVNIPDSDSFTPLNFACSISNSQIVQLLLNHGADPNNKIGNVQSPLFSSLNSSKIFQILLDHGADAEAVSRTNFPILCEATITNKIKFVKILMKNKHVQVNRKSVIGKTALHHACDQGHLEIVNELLQAKADPNIPDDIRRTPLFLASANGHTAIVKRLVEAQADPNISDIEGITPLSIASAHGHVEVVECLLHAKADPNTRNNDGLPPLWIACDEGHDSVVKCLLQAQADPNISSGQYSLTPLGIASGKGHKSVVKYLLHAGADPNIRNGNGTTPLWIAANQGHEGVVQQLIEANADPHIHNNEDFTPLQIAMGRNHIHTGSILFNHILASCETHEEMLEWIAKAKRQLSVELVHFLLNAQENPSILDSM